MIRRLAPYLPYILVTVSMIVIMALRWDTTWDAQKTMPPNTIYFNSWVRMGSWGSAARTPDGRWWFRTTFGRKYQEVQP